MTCFEQTNMLCQMNLSTIPLFWKCSHTAPSYSLFSNFVSSNQSEWCTPLSTCHLQHESSRKREHKWSGRWLNLIHHHTIWLRIICQRSGRISRNMCQHLLLRRSWIGRRMPLRYLRLWWCSQFRCSIRKCSQFRSSMHSGSWRRLSPNLPTTTNYKYYCSCAHFTHPKVHTQHAP